MAYPFKEIEAKWQAHWDSQSHLSHAGESRHRRSRSTTCSTCSRTRRARAARRPPRGLHRDRHRRALQAHARLQRAAPDGLGRVRPAGRAVRAQDRHASARSRPSATSAASAGSSSRSASPTTGSARSTPPIPATTSGRSGSSCSSSSAGLAYQDGAARLLVPGARHGAGQRGSHRRQVRGRRLPVVRRPLRQWMLQDHRYADALLDDLDDARLARVARRRCSATGSAAAKARRSTSRSTAHAGGRQLRVFTTRPDTLFGATYMVLAPEHPLVDELTTPEQRAAVEAYRDAGVAQERPRAHRAAERRRPASSPARTPINPGDRRARSRSGSPTTCSRATAPARSWRCRRTTSATSSSRRSSSCRSFARCSRRPDFDGDERVHRRRHSHQLRLLERPERRAGEGRDDRLARDARRRASGASTTSCATGCSRASATGASRSRSCSSTASRSTVPDAELPVLLPELEDFKPTGTPEGPLAKAAAIGSTTTDAEDRQARAPRDEHDAAVGRLVLVLPALPRSRRTTRGSSIRELEKLLDARRPLRRRRRARRAAPALRALLAQGALRRGRRVDARAVPEAREPGHDPGRAGVHAVSRRRRHARIRGARARRQRHAHRRRAERRTSGRRRGREAGRPVRAERRNPTSPSTRAPTR